MHAPDPALPQVIDDCHELLKWLIPLLGQTGSDCTMHSHSR